MDAAQRCDMPAKPANWTRRAWGLLWASAGLALLVCGAMIPPRSQGYGTHQELGLSGCSILARTGWPCPTCGLTTSVSATLHGRPGLALRAQPAGMVLVAAAAVSVVLGAAQLVRPGTLPKRFRPRLSWLLAALGVLLLGWACAMLTGVIEGRFPTH